MRETHLSFNQKFTGYIDIV